MQFNKLQNEAHVWLVSPESIQNSRVITQFFSLLSTEEIKKHNRFHFPEDKHRYLVSHAFVRQVLSKYLNKQPGELEFHYTRNGKPEVLLNQNDQIVRFNLSHTKGLTACIVTINDACGIDTEKIDHKTASIDVARLMFSNSEFKFLKSLSGHSFLAEFFSRWTLREAYVKALGHGIDYPTNKLLFNIKNNQEIEISFQGKTNEAFQHWQFQIMQPTSEHMVTIAIQSNSKKLKSIICKWLQNE